MTNWSDEEDFYRPVEDSWFTRLLLTIGGLYQCSFYGKPAIVRFEPLCEMVPVFGRML